MSSTQQNNASGWNADPNEPGPFDFYNEITGLAATCDGSGHITLRVVPALNREKCPDDSWRGDVSATFELGIDDLIAVVDIARRVFAEHCRQVDAKRKGRAETEANIDPFDVPARTPEQEEDARKLAELLSWFGEMGLTELQRLRISLIDEEAHRELEADR